MVVVVGCLLAACGSSGPSATTTTGGSAATAPGTAQLPAVAGATDLNKEPVISPGSQPPPTSLQTRDLVVGTGTAAVASSTVSVRYVGADYANGQVFDDSPWKSGQPTPFALSGVVPGFGQGIVGMKVGGRREIVIPSALGYGATGDPPAVAGNETLVFVVDLVQIA